MICICIHFFLFTSKFTFSLRAKVVYFSNHLDANNNLACSPGIVNMIQTILKIVITMLKMKTRCCSIII